MQLSGRDASGTPAADHALSEQHSLALGLWVSLAIAVLSLLTYALSGSEAVLLNGLYAGVMAVTSLVAARVGANVVRPPDRGWPFGYEGQEAVYVLLRSLLLLGILSFAGLNAARDLLAWWQGDTPEAIASGPVGWYGLMVLALVETSWLDGLRDQLEQSCTTLLGPVRAEVVLTGRPPFSDAVAAQ